MAIQSRYACIWIQLKQKREVRLSAPADMHWRLKRNVIKIKNRDLGYKVLMSEQNLRPHLTFKSEGNVFSIKLHLPTRHLWL